MNKAERQITQHIRYGLTPLPLGTFAFGERRIYRKRYMKWLN